MLLTLLPPQFVPLGYRASELNHLDSVIGSSPYGAACIAGGDGSKKPTEQDKSVATQQASLPLSPLCLRDLLTSLRFTITGNLVCRDCRRLRSRQGRLECSRSVVLMPREHTNQCNVHVHFKNSRATSMSDHFEKLTPSLQP